MKRCPGPKPGQACVVDTLSLHGEVWCCPIDPPVSDEPILCSDTEWFTDSVNGGVFKDGEPCWWRRGRASMVAGPPPTPLDWTSTWYVRDEVTGAEVCIATLDHDNPNMQNGLRGDGVCYDGDEVVFSSRVDVSAEHCRPWYPECEVPGICPVPPVLRDPSDAGPRDAAPEAAMSTDSDTTVDAPTLPDASPDAPQDG
jgi:hypothetical protein